MIQFSCQSKMNVAANKYLKIDINGTATITAVSATVYVDGENLVGLYFGQNSTITILICSDNQLTSLDVSGNTNLEAFDCNNNQLTSLDVSANSNLEKLLCKGNQLTSLDVSANSNLEQLICYDNQLTSLDISAISNLSSLEFYCYSNPTLQLIDFGQTQQVLNFNLRGSTGT
jgi:Leucine-rich repeat (LRR) protein